MTREAPAPRGALDVEALLETVRAAGDGASDAKASLRARQTRAAEPDIMGTLAGLPDGSPLSQRLRAGLREQGVTAKAIDAAVKWHRAQRRGEYSILDDEDPRPTIRVTDDLHIDVAATVQALEFDPDLYARSGALVRVVAGDAGEPLIAPHTAATLRVRLCMFARWTKTNESGEVETCLPPDAITLAVLEAREWKGIRVLAGIVETPTMRPDRTVSQRPGYDPATRTLHIPSTTFPEIPEKPTHQEACEAMRFLWVETSYDFPFRGLGYADPSALASDPDGVFRYAQAYACPDAWGVTSAIFTIVSRPAIDGDTPAILFDAAAPGSGKGLQADVSALATLGRIPEKLVWPKQSDQASTDTEVEKRLIAPIVEGASVIVWDEILGPFGGPAINSVLTCRGRTKLRIIGTPNAPTLSYAATMLGTGNNITARDNTHRRALVPRLESPDENPADHTGWRVPDLRASVKALRPRLVVAALTVLRAYVCAGSPATYERNGETLPMPPTWGGGFEQWSELVVRAMLWAGGGNVLGCRPTSDPEARNEERDAVAAVVDAIARLEPRTEDVATGDGITLRDVINRLYTRERIKGEDTTDDGFEAAREAIDAICDSSGRKPQSKKLGDRLFVWRKRPIDGRMLEPAKKKDRTGAQRWTVRMVK